MTKGKAKVVTLEVKALKAALADVRAAVEARNTVPVLSNLLVSVEPTSMTLQATDLDIWVIRYLPLEPTVDASTFSTTICAATLTSLVGKLDAEAQVSILIEDGKAKISSGRARFSLPTLPAEDFPQAPNSNLPVAFEMSGLILGAAFDRVAHAISTEEVRYYLNGVYLHVAENAQGVKELVLVTTDGHRLAIDRRDLPEGADDLPAIIVSRKTVKLVGQLLAKHEGQVGVHASSNKVEFEIGPTRVFAKTIDGQFPDWNRVVPNNKHVLKVDRAALASAIDRVVTVSTDKARTTALEINRDVITLTVSSAEAGIASEEIECSYDGPSLRIGFNARYMQDALGKMLAPSIEAMMDTADGAALWRDEQGAPSTFILMPTRV